MKALVFDRPHEMAVKDIPTPVPASDQVLIKVKASGICGTDIHILEGGFPCDYPLVPGHEFCGEVVQVGEHCRRFAVGDRVAVEPNVPCNNCLECLRGEHHFCRNMVVPGVNRGGGFGEYVAVSENAVFGIGDLSYEAAALVEPLSCVIHAVERLNPQIGDKALVMGAGPIGLLLGRVLKSRGVLTVDYLERSQERREKVAEESLGRVFGTTDEVPEKSYELVLDATGVSGLMTDAIDRYVRIRGKVLIFGVPKPESDVKFNHFRAFRDEIQIIASFTSLKNTMQAIDLMNNGTIKVSDVISHQIPLSECPDFIERMRASDGSLRKVLVTEFSA